MGRRHRADSGPDGCRPVATLPLAKCYSFSQTKTLTTGGEGGLIVTDDEALAVECAKIRRFESRMTEYAAARGLAGLPGLDAEIARRRAAWAAYGKRLMPLGFAFQPEPPGWESSRKDIYVRCPRGVPSGHCCPCGYVYVGGREQD